MDQAASEGWVSFPGESGAPQGDRRRVGAARKGLSWIAGALATAIAVTLAAFLTLVFAATLAVFVVLSGALIAVYGLTHRRRPQGVLIEARRVGHSWVAYGWDQRPR
jgi:hypothetical protein